MGYPFQNKPWFLRVCSYENTVGKGEIARYEHSVEEPSGEHSVFYPFGEPSAVFIKFKIVVCQLFQFTRV